MPGQLVQLSIGVAVAVVAGCGLPDPVNQEVAPPGGAQEATEIAVSEWSERVPGAEDLDVGDLPPIRWFEGVPCECAGCTSAPFCLLDSGGIADKAGKYRWTAFEAEIQLVVFPTIHESGLTHEILHWTLHKAAGDPDDLHEGAIWDQVDEVNEILRAVGL